MKKGRFPHQGVSGPRRPRSQARCGSSPPASKLPRSAPSGEGRGAGQSCRHSLKPPGFQQVARGELSLGPTPQACAFRRADSAVWLCRAGGHLRAGPWRWWVGSELALPWGSAQDLGRSGGHHVLAPPHPHPTSSTPTCSKKEPELVSKRLLQGTEGRKETISSLSPWLCAGHFTQIGPFLTGTLESPEDHPPFTD